MTRIKTIFAAVTLPLLLLLGLSSPASANNYPTRTITLIVPFAAGGGVDVMGRILAQKLEQNLGQTIVVENKPGASGMLGANYLTKAKPDGYTLMLGSAGETAINPYVYRSSMLYDPFTDLTPISAVTLVPNVLVTGPSADFSTLADLIDFSRDNPDAIAYATSGVGNPQHLNGALLEDIAQVQMLHVPYKGAAEQLSDVASGNVEMTFVSYAAAQSFINSGKVKALAVTAPERVSFAPDVPAIAETPGLEEYALENWFGLFGPADIPEEIVHTINLAIVEALEDPELAKSLVTQGGVPAPMSPQEFRDFIQQESEQYAQIIEKANITAEN